MMDSNYRFFIYLAVLFLAVLSGIYRLRERDSASKIVVVLLFLTLISEYAAHLAAVYYRNNMFVYHLFAPIQMIIVGIYFDNIIQHFRKRRIATIIGIVAATAAVVNVAFFQSLKILNSNFLLFEGLVIMGLALYTFQCILTDDNIDIYKYGHFWIIVIFIFFWSITYTWWALYTVLQVEERMFLSNVTKVLWFVNIITYSAMGFILLYFSGKRFSQ